MLQILPIFRAFALILAMFGSTMLVPLGFAWLFQDGAEAAFDNGLMITLGSALVLWLVSYRDRRELQIKDGFLLVVLTWTLLPGFAAIPLMDFFWPRLSFTEAYFETMSGITTTGATVLSDLDKLPFSINLWRGELVWLGGMGLIVLAVAILPLLGVGGRQMFKAESPGPMKESKLTPRMAETAKGLWKIYGLISLACFLSCWAAGMTWRDALIHLGPIMGLGGFSSHDASFGFFDSLAIEGVTIFFMYIAGMNFATHFLAFQGRSLLAYRGDPEAGWFVGVTTASVIGIALFLWVNGTYGDFWESLRFSAFNVVSIATTTGFASTDYSLWPIFAPRWMLFLCSFATCAGSTGGGVKMIRAIILYKQTFREVMRSMHPNLVKPIKVGGAVVPNAIVFAVLAFGFMYMVLTVSLTLAMAFSGLDIVTAFSAVVACLNNTGPGLNQVGPATTYAVLTDYQTWICTLAMLLGRLEIFTLLVVLTPSFWLR